MAKHKIALIPGDGIGKEVLPEGVRVLEAAARRFNFQLEFTDFDWSCDRLLQTGKMMPEDGMEQLKAFESIFLGAVGWPGVPDHVSLWGLLIPIRRDFDEYVNLQARPPVRGRAVAARQPQAGRDRFLGGAREHRGRVQPDRRPHVPGHRRSRWPSRRRSSRARASTAC